MNRIYLVIILFMGLAPLLSGQVEVIDKVVAQVGSEVLLLSEVEDNYSLLQKRQGGLLPENARCFILDNLLAQKLLLHHAKLDSVEVTDEEVESQLDIRFSQILKYMNNDYSQFETYYGKTVQAAKRQMREDLKNQILVERMQGQIMASATITPSEVKAFYERIPTDSLPYFNSEVELGEIVAYPEVNEVERAKSRTLLDDIREKIVSGEASFEDMARKWSDDGSSQTGGDLGWASRGDYVLEFEGAAYNLDPMEISPVIETDFGLHILQLLERRGNNIHVRHILIRPKITSEDLALTYNRLDSVRSLILDDSISFSQAVKKYSSDKEQSYNNDGRMINPATGNTFYEISDLDPDIYFAMDTMAADEISAPMEFKSPQGEKGYRLIWLQSRTPPHRANLKTDYSRIREAALEEKKNIIISDWVEEKVDNTFLRIEAPFNTCPELEKWATSRH